MTDAIKRKILLNVFIMVGFLLVIPVLQNQVQGQNSVQPSAANLEEELAKVEEKIRNIFSFNEY